ncbi:hypothetical protein KSD_52350 [Ktedonobacter sp. SOSP1-85]|uniref:hypothetical protein n=1 Tax=Ktedonobacter sp. SOSP1-85 TaxID=2778367 RepID=UPI0019164E76|nr:hypothetical protein [Ktedonobacter sp. SOSP1-85]GHO77464.1 hypothetical protein KSD_52350 [Ktedonobacter sp. SOSP1-85]
MWMIAHYLPVSFFSLRPANATSSGGKTLLIPTPFALKMALLGAAIRTRGLAEGEHLFPFLRDLELYLEPPEEMIVVKSFSKIRRELKDKSNAEKAQKAREKKEYPMQPTIAYREYVNYKGSMSLACQLSDDSPLAPILPELLMCINYLGKRGGFLQMLEKPYEAQALPEGRFIHLTAGQMQDFEVSGTLQMLDDCGPSLTFQKADTYNEARIVLHKDRILRHIVIPYAPTRSSRSYSWYQRLDASY